jgi:energy-coupling factor transporter ATP-binding protein EcfA2
MNKPTIKIFISSPSDVLYERQIAKRIIAKLAKEFAASVTLEALLWEDMPLQVTLSFQEGIDQIVNANLVDIAVFILWSRLGTPLSEKFVKPDGSYYKSGTEYEFEVMYAANQQSGTPSILAYIKNAPVADAIFQSSANADFDFEEIGRQHKEAQRFIREKFYDPETKTVYGAYHQFEAPTTFEQKLTEHLRRLVIHKIGHEAVQIEWEGNPYVGLRSFRYDENAIFYGRRHTINAIEEKVARRLPDKTPCLFVLGESGSGKSSLVRAGLLPDLIEFGWVENTKWKWFDLMPSQFRGNIYNGILSKLGEAFPVLNEKSIGKDLLTGKEVNFGHLSDILPDTADESVLFFIDQFEEIFTDPLITEEERIRTFALLRGMASTHKIWMIFSMRNDFYYKFTGYPALSELKNDSIVYDLPKILHSELQEIIDEPARKAGLKWETNEQGISLNRAIIHDINSGVDDLPLIEFALSELYNLRDENNRLTYKAYEDIGKIGGAVIQYVDNFHNTLSDKEKELFY